MTDYSSQKVPELKKLLQDRGLAVSGNKADLIARLQESDKKDGGKPCRLRDMPQQTRTDIVRTAGEDEIDWDEDDKPTTEPAAAAVAAGGIGPVDTPLAVPNQKDDIDPSKTEDLKVGEPKAETEAVKSPEAALVPEAPKEDFTAGLEKTDAQKEADRRAARAKRFGIPENDEAKKLAERAKKFGTGADPVVSSLDSALPERRPKRGREEKDGGRAAKRQTPDRRTEKPKAKQQPKAAPAKKQQPSGKITDDPAEKLKAEARAKRFAKVDK